MVTCALGYRFTSTHPMKVLNLGSLKRKCYMSAGQRSIECGCETLNKPSLQTLSQTSRSQYVMQGQLIGHLTSITLKLTQLIMRACGTTLRTYNPICNIMILQRLLRG